MTLPENDPGHDPELHGLMRDAVSGVHPHGRPADIRRRADASGRHGSSWSGAARRWAPLSLAAAVATVGIIGGTAWFADRGQGDPATTGPTAPGSVRGATSTAPGNPIEVPAYYVGPAAAGPRLFKELRAVDAQGRDPLQAAIDEALSRRPHDPDYHPSMLMGATAKVTAHDGVITIDLSDVPVPGNVAGNGEISLQALVWTADTASGTDDQVVFLKDGRRVDRLLGVDTSQPLSRATSDSVLSPVSITTPGDDAQVPARFDVTGEAATFEGNVVWELKKGETVVRTGHTTTAEAFVQSPYSFEVSATPGTYLLVVHDTDESGGEGVGVTEDTRAITVRAGF